MYMEHAPDFEMLRAQTIGCDASIETPFGERLMVYADYTASGRCLTFVEQYLQDLQRIYANSHTEDDISGRSMTQLTLRQYAMRHNSRLIQFVLSPSRLRLQNASEFKASELDPYRLTSNTHQLKP